MIKEEFKIVIKVDEKNISKKYSNYDINWESPGEFIKYLGKTLEEDHLKEFGYSVKLKEIKK